MEQVRVSASPLERLGWSCLTSLLEFTLLFLSVSCNTLLCYILSHQSIPHFLFLLQFLLWWLAARQEKHRPHFPISWFPFGYSLNFEQTQGGWSTSHFGTIHRLTFLSVLKPWLWCRSPSLWCCLTNSPVSTLASSMIETRFSLHWARFSKSSSSSRSLNQHL